jgi:precorrin isomerase
MISDPTSPRRPSVAKLSRALLAVRKAKDFLSGAVALVGNAPLALAEIVRLREKEGIKPAAVIGMPVGFVNVVESKDLLFASDIPYISIEGRRGGSPLAVAALHGAIEGLLK